MEPYENQRRSKLVHFFKGKIEKKTSKTGTKQNQDIRPNFEQNAEKRTYSDDKDIQFVFKYCPLMKSKIAKLQDQYLIDFCLRNVQWQLFHTYSYIQDYQWITDKCITWILLDKMMLILYKNIMSSLLFN